MKKPNLKRLKWWHWLALAAAVVVVWFLYKRHTASQAGAAAGNDALPVTPTGITSPSAGGSPSTVTAPSDGLTSDVAGQLGQQQSDFLAALQQSQSDALAQIADLLATSPNIAPSGTNPGGPNKPSGVTSTPTRKGFQWGNVWVTKQQQLIDFEHRHGNTHFDFGKWERQHPAAVKAAGWA